MELFIKVLQGPYTYLLVLQVLVVSGLCLALIYLVMRRTQEAAMATAHASGEATMTATAAPVVDNAKVEELGARIIELEKENAALKAGGGDTKSLQEKVKYLESKLLEYEILQEEIGTLTALKMENEHLRKQLAAKGQAPAAAVSAPAPAPTESAPSLAIDELGAPPPAADAPLMPETAPPGVVIIPPEAAAQADSVPATPADDPQSAGMEGLLKQIDDIAGATKG